MKTKKHISICLIVIILLVCTLPFPKKIDGVFPTIYQDGKETIVTVKGTYYDYLILHDKFNGVLIDETGFEYPSVKKQDIISETSVNDKIALPIQFAYVYEGKAEFVTAYFEEDLAEIIYCILCINVENM